MSAPRWRKILSDLWSNKARTTLVILSIVVGVFSVGVVAGSYFILRNDVPRAFSAAQPHSAEIYTQYFDDDFLEMIGKTEGVAQVEGRSSVSGVVQTPQDKKVTISITGIPALNEMNIDRVDLEAGSSSLAFKEIYLERSSVTPLSVAPGDFLRLEIGDHLVREVQVAGIVHDVWASSYSLAGYVTAYASPETMEWLGGSRLSDRLLLTVSERGQDEVHVKAVANEVADKITRGGREVFVTVVFQPGRHPAQQTVDSVLILLGGMGMLALLLSTFLVVNTINGLLSQQVRQIGVMKSVGATSGQITGLYMVLILIFGVLALLVAIPLAGGAAYLLAMAVAQLLNLDLMGFRITTESLVLQIIVGLGVPLLAGVVPVLNGAHKTVREAITNYGLVTGGSRSFLDGIMESVQVIPRPWMISIRNTFRKKARLALTLSTLVLGGAIFIAVLNVRDSLYQALDTTFGYILSDVNVEFGRMYRMERIQAAVKDIPGVVSMEGWGFSNAQVIHTDKSGEDVVIFAPPAGSTLIKPVMTAGRWLTAEDENAVVVGNHYMKLHPETEVGDQISIRFENHDHTFTIVGIYQMAGTVLNPILYINFEYLSTILNEAGQVYSIRVVTDQHDPARQSEVAKALETRFNEEGFALGGITTGSETISQQRVTIDVLIYLLIAMAVLIAIVGGLGLMGTMGMNVLERTREIGVMRSIGAVDAVIMRLVVVEGMVIGMISWVFGVLFSLPIARVLNTIIGTSLLNVPLDYIFSMQGLILWAIVVVVISTLASVLPARNAVRLTVRDILAYE